MGMQWWAQQIGPDTWHVFVHRPLAVAGFEIKPLIGSSVGSLPATEVVPRMVSLAQQLQHEQRLQVTGVAAADVEAIRQQVVQASALATRGLPRRMMHTSRATHVA